MLLLHVIIVCTLALGSNNRESHARRSEAICGVVSRIESCAATLDRLYD